MNKPQFSKTALALITVLILGLAVAPAAVSAASHLNSGGDNTNPTSDSMNDMEQEMDNMQNDLNSMFDSNDDSNSETEATRANQATVAKKKYKKKKVKKRQRQRGQLRVCKLLINENDSVIRGQNLDASFSVDVSNDEDRTFSASTPLDLNSDLNDNEINDSECTTYSDLSLGTYEYSEEDVSGNDSDQVNVTGYNDNFQVGEDDLASFNAYGESDTSDGQVQLTRNNSQQTVVVLNQRVEEEEEAAVTPNVTQRKPVKKKYMKKKVKKQPRQPVQGQLRVCKLLVDENDTVTRGGDVDAQFNVDVNNSQDRTFSASTPLDLNGDLNDNNISDSECQTYENLDLGTYTFSEEDVSGDDSDRINVLGYNPDFQVGQDDLNSFEDYEDVNNEVELTRDNRQQTVVVLNQVEQEEEEAAVTPNVTQQKPKKKGYYAKKKVKKRQPVQGQLQVCKLLINENDSVIRGTSIPGAQFDVDVSNSQDRTFTAETPLNLNSDLNDNNISDSECTTYRNLELGDYEYSEEAISGNNTDRVNVTGYNDDFQVGQDDLASFDAYGESSTSDGEITLTRDNRQQTLVVLNERVEEEEEEAVTPNVTQKKPKKKGYFAKKGMQLQLPTTDVTTDTAEDEMALEEEEQALEEDFTEEEMAEEEFTEEEMAEEEEASDASATQEANSNIIQDCNVDASNNSSATCEQEANSNIEQDADVDASGGGSASAIQEANSNIEQNADVSAS